MSERRLTKEWQVSDFDHVATKNPNEKLTYWWRNEYPEVYDVLAANDFGRYHEMYPSETDEMVFLNYADRTLAKDLDKFEESGELY